MGKQEDAEAMRERLVSDLYYKKPLFLIKTLISKHPDVLLMGDESGCTPLHRAIEYKSSFETIQLLLKRCPKALSIQNSGGWTALHFACAYKAPLEVVQLLTHAYPEATGTISDDGRTPLHCAAKFIQPLEVIQYLADCWPIACAIADSDEHLPLANAKQRNHDSQVLEYLEHVTINAACAVIDVALSPVSAMPWPVIAHVAEVIASNFSSTHNDHTVFSQLAQSQITWPLLEKLLKNKELQAFLLDRRYKSILRGFLRMNKAGRKYALSDPRNKNKGSAVLASVKHSVDSLFLHLRENPSLCEARPQVKPTRSRRKIADASVSNESFCEHTADLSDSPPSFEIKINRGHNPFDDDQVVQEQCFDDKPNCQSKDAFEVSMVSGSSSLRQSLFQKYKAEEDKYKAEARLAHVQARAEARLADIQADREENELRFELLKQRKELQRLGCSREEIDAALPLPQKTECV